MIYKLIWEKIKNLFAGITESWHEHLDFKAAFLREGIIIKEYMKM